MTATAAINSGGIRVILQCRCGKNWTFSTVMSEVMEGRFRREERNNKTVIAGKCSCGARIDFAEGPDGIIYADELPSEISHFAKANANLAVITDSAPDLSAARKSFKLAETHIKSVGAASEATLAALHKSVHAEPVSLFSDKVLATNNEIQQRMQVTQSKLQEAFAIRFAGGNVSLKDAKDFISNMSEICSNLESLLVQSCDDIVELKTVCNVINDGSTLSTFTDDRKLTGERMQTTLKAIYLAIDGASRKLFKQPVGGSK